MKKEPRGETDVTSMRNVVDEIKRKKKKMV